MTGIMSEWVMSTIEDNLEAPRVPSSVHALIESSQYLQEQKSQNMINMQLDREKSKIEHTSSNISHPSENVAHARPIVSHEEEEIQNSKFEYESSKRPRKLLKRKTGNKQLKELKRSQKMRLRVGLKMRRKRKPHLSPGKTRKTMKLYSENLYLFQKMVKNIMT